jgi:hypothetical protein
MTDKEILNRITEVLPGSSDAAEVRQKLQARLDWIAEVGSAIQVMSRTSLKAAEHAEWINRFAHGTTLMAAMSDQFLEANDAGIQAIVLEARQIVQGVTGFVK